MVRICSVCLFSMILLGTVGLVGCRGGSSTQPPIHPQQNMDNQNRVDAQEASGLFADGRGMRPRVDFQRFWVVRWCSSVLVARHGKLAVRDPIAQCREAGY